MLLPLRVVGTDAAQKKKMIVKALEELEIETRPVLTGNFLAQPAMKTIGTTVRSQRISLLQQ